MLPLQQISVQDPGSSSDRQSRSDPVKFSAINSQAVTSRSVTILPSPSRGNNSRWHVHNGPSSLSRWSRFSDACHAPHKHMQLQLCVAYRSDLFDSAIQKREKMSSTADGTHQGKFWRGRGGGIRIGWKAEGPSYNCVAEPVCLWEKSCLIEKI